MTNAKYATLLSETIATARDASNSIATAEGDPARLAWVYHVTDPIRPRFRTVFLRFTRESETTVDGYDLTPAACFCQGRPSLRGV